MLTKITCIMPCSRPADLLQAIPLFIAQDYPNKELLILMDIEGYTRDTDNENHVYQWGMPKMSIGAKRNHLCGFAKGDIIVHIDSDDYYAPDWITKSVEALADNDMTGLRAGYFYNIHTNVGKHYISTNPQPYCMGATMCYRKRIWERNKFNENVPYGEDAMFMGYAGKVKNHDYQNGFTALIHGNNTQSHMALSSMRVVDRNKIPYVNRHNKV